MLLADVKTALGVGRIVWIDDMFGQAKPELALLAMRHPEVAAGFPELRDLLAARDYRDVADDVAQVIQDQPDERQEEIGQALLQADAVPDPADELPLGALEAACDALGVAPQDRLGFDDGEAFIVAGTAGADVAIVIDLKDAGGPERRGLDLLDRCREVGFAGVAFIMTHDATIETEAAQEAALRGDMAADAALPVTVIAKDRLRADGDVEAAMAVALKRAGLRQVLRPLLSQTGRLVADTYEEVTASLLQLEPERLQRYVYGSAADEGESELQVVERMISAGLSRAVRRFMATDAVALETTRRLRDLPDIALDIAADGPGEAIADLRQAELWDEGDVVNPSYRPLANGDVFEVDAVEPGVPVTGRLFVLLGQPCDVALRPKGTRVSDVAMLVPLFPGDGEEAEPENVDLADGEKAPDLPFTLFGKLYQMRLRELAYVRLSILDLATFRSDGRVMVEQGQAMPLGMPKGSAAIYAAATNAALAVLGGAAPAGQPTLLPDERLLLTMSANAPWKQVRSACHLPPVTRDGVALRKRVTWRLRRKGRLRPPYSTFMLDRVLGLQGRRAFDKDYTAAAPPGNGG